MDYLIRFLPSERSIRVPPGTTLLEAARRARLPVAQACTGRGSCGRCGMRILEGAEHLPAEDETERRAKARNRVDAELRLSCLIALSGDLTVTAAYW